MSRRRRKRLNDVSMNLKIQDEDGNVIWRIEGNLRKSLKNFVKMCDEKFSIDLKEL